MSKALTDILDCLSLTQTGEMQFEGTSPDNGWKRIYGGQVVAQAIIAASKTVPDDRHLHLNHSLFLRLGDVKQPIDFIVTNLRDGGSFSARRVDVKQNDLIIYTMTASFHKEEHGFNHQDQMPDFRSVNELPDFKKLLEQVKINFPEASGYINRDRPIEMRPVDLTRYIKKGQTGLKAEQAYWIKPAGQLPANQPLINLAMLAFSTDYTLLDTALIPHGKTLFDGTMMMASLDHCIWFHRQTDFNKWHLYIQHSPSAKGARGYAIGQLYNEQGDLILSSAQEGLMRLRTKPTKSMKL